MSFHRSLKMSVSSLSSPESQPGRQRLASLFRAAESFRWPEPIRTQTSLLGILPWRLSVPSLVEGTLLHKASESFPGQLPFLWHLATTLHLWGFSSMLKTKVEAQIMKHVSHNTKLRLCPIKAYRVHPSLSPLWCNDFFLLCCFLFLRQDLSL